MRMVVPNRLSVRPRLELARIGLTDQSAGEGDVGVDDHTIAAHRRRPGQGQFAAPEHDRLGAGVMQRGDLFSHDLTSAIGDRIGLGLEAVVRIVNDRLDHLLLRRIIRDRHARGTNAAENIMRWPSVRAGERKHIFPFQHNANAVFDSSLIYELAVLKVFAERYLLEVPQSHPAYTTAFRLLQLVDRFVAIYPDHVPPTSILREFIGGSGFEY